jgi:hypothetical protein
LQGKKRDEEEMVNLEEAQVLLLLDVPLVAMPRGSGSGLFWEYSRKESHSIL